MKIELNGSEKAFRLLIQEIMDGHQFINRDQGHPLYNFVQELEDQLETNGPRQDGNTSIDIDELFEE